MKVLCAIGSEGGQEVLRRVLGVIGSQPDLYLLHVIDTGPRHTLEEYLHRPGPLRRPPPPPPGPGSMHPTPPPPPGRERPIDEAELVAGNAALEEARQEAERAGFHFQTELLRGKPEQAIVQMAQTWGCQLIAIQASQGTQGRPHIGPESVGHTARFVLDHAPCDVLLLREI
ncbi:MAG: universal stress protein [Anaerolineales bacterium]